jgi:hypothetical protein
MQNKELYDFEANEDGTIDDWKEFFNKTKV